MSYYDEVHARYYDFTSLGVPGDLPFYVDEAKKSGSPVLELACGTGRILISAARAGVEIVGLDASAPMISIARKKVARLDDETQSRITLTEGDMREFSFDKKFKLIMIPFRSFLHLLTPEDQRMALNCIHEHLVDDGKLVFNIFDFRMDMMVAHSGPLGSALTKQSEWDNPDSAGKVMVWDSKHYDPQNQTVYHDLLFEDVDVNGLVTSRSYSKLKARWIYRYEMQYLLELCGFEVEALYGDFDRGPYKYGGEQVWVAKKRK